MRTRYGSWRHSGEDIGLYESYEVVLGLGFGR
jgi:hypothetical protein